MYPQLHFTINSTVCRSQIYKEVQVSDSQGTSITAPSYSGVTNNSQQDNTRQILIQNVRPQQIPALLKCQKLNMLGISSLYTKGVCYTRSKPLQRMLGQEASSEDLSIVWLQIQKCMWHIGKGLAVWWEWATVTPPLQMSASHRTKMQPNNRTPVISSWFSAETVPQMLQADVLFASLSSSHRIIKATSRSQHHTQVISHLFPHPLKKWQLASLPECFLSRFQNWWHVPKTLSSRSWIQEWDVSFFTPSFQLQKKKWVSADSRHRSI